MSSPDADLAEHFPPRGSFEIGSFQFAAEDIIAFASAWDPQDFHVDAEKARNSLLGGLCASGWHTVSIWMKLQRKSLAKQTATLVKSGKTPPEFGPSPGMKHLKWIKPVYAGDTITYTNTVSSIRQSKSKPGWHIMQTSVEAVNQHFEPVMSFESAVFLRLAP